MKKIKAKVPKKECVFKLRIPVYGGSLKVVFTDSIVGALERASNDPKSPVDTDDIFGDPMGVTFCDEDTDEILIFVDTNEGTAVTLAHELMHVCAIVLDRIGVQFSPDSEEAYTYLHSTLMYSCMAMLKKHKINVW